MLQIEILNIMIFFVISIGMIILIIGLVFMKEKNQGEHSSNKNENFEKELESQINEADKMLQELNHFSSYIKEELDNKYKELLFIYQLIDEKGKELSNDKIQLVSEKNDKNSSDKDNNDHDLEALQILNNKNYDQIIKLYKEGNDISSIAKKLNIGKGEVQLILGLAKMR